MHSLDYSIDCEEAVLMLYEIGGAFKIKELSLVIYEEFQIEPSLIPMTVEKLELYSSLK